MEVRIIHCRGANQAKAEVWYEGRLITTLEVNEAFGTTNVKTTFNIKADDQTHEFSFKE